MHIVTRGPGLTRFSGAAADRGSIIVELSYTKARNALRGGSGPLWCALLLVEPGSAADPAGACQCRAAGALTTIVFGQGCPPPWSQRADRCPTAIRLLFPKIS